eukprot:354084-Chlamydomonas_euryale.AAC.9
MDCIALLPGTLPDVHACEDEQQLCILATPQAAAVDGSNTGSFFLSSSEQQPLSAATAERSNTAHPTSPCCPPDLQLPPNLGVPATHPLTPRSPRPTLPIPCL